MDAIWIAVIAAVASIAVGVGSPVLLAILSGHQAAGRQKAEWERQDQVAKKTEEVARLLRETNQRQAEDTKIINGKIDGITVMVDGTLTVAMKSDLESTKRSLVLMQELVALRGGKASFEAASEIQAAQARVTALTATIADRIRQEKVALGLRARPA